MLQTQDSSVYIKLLENFISYGAVHHNFLFKILQNFFNRREY